MEVEGSLQNPQKVERTVQVPWCIFSVAITEGGGWISWLDLTGSFNLCAVWDGRFRRDAANLLDILSGYQKRQIVEFLPYHHCDMMTSQSPDVGCVMELQARYTQYRHTIFLTGTQNPTRAVLPAPLL